MSSRRFDQDECIRLSPTSSGDVFKTSLRRLGQDQYNRLGYTSSRRFQDVLTETYLESGRTSTMEFFAEILNSFKVLTISQKKPVGIGF